MGKSKGKKKGKGGDKGSKGKKAKPVVDGLLPNEMSRGQLLGHAVRLQAEMEKEKVERNYFMLEREKIFQLWNLLLEMIQMEKEKAALFEAHMQDVEREKEGEDDLYNKKLRFLKQEQTRKLGQIRLLHLTKMKHIQDEAWELQMVMREALMGKKKEIRRAQMAFFQIIRGLYWAHAREVSDLRSEFAREIRRLESQFDRRMFENSDKRDEEQAVLVTKLAERKEVQVHKLVDSHRYQSRELQKFFRDLIRHNLILVYGMKDAAKKQKMYELRAKKDYEGFKEKYDKYIACAVKWKQDIEQWEIEHADDFLEMLEEDLHQANVEVKRLRHTLRMLECSNETIRQHMVIADKEKVNLKNEFNRSVVDVQKRTSMNRFIQQIKQQAAKREADMHAALADNFERDPSDEMDYFAELIFSRNQQKDEIQQDITEYATEHKDTEDTYKYAFRRNEINLADIGFPILKTGAKVRGVEEDMLALSTAGGSGSGRSSRGPGFRKNKSGAAKTRSVALKKSQRNLAAPAKPSTSAASVPSSTHA